MRVHSEIRGRSEKEGLTFFPPGAGFKEFLAGGLQGGLGLVFLELLQQSLQLGR